MSSHPAVVSGGGYFLVSNLTSVLVVFGLLAIASTVLWVWALVDVVRINDRVWADAEQSKIVWVIVIVFLHWFGAILYFLIAKPALKRAVVV